jgi:hypothetical protein
MKKIKHTKSEKFLLLQNFLLGFPILIGLIVFFCLFFDNGFPIPWVDESYFLHQALSFAHKNTLVTSSLILDRPVMWMPPGYVVFMGLVYKLIDFSLQSARIVSLAFYCFTVVLFAYAMRMHSRNLVILFATVIFLNPSSLAVANVARMDSMVLALALGVLVALISDRCVIAVALAVFASLVHPNGVYLFLPIGMAIVLTFRLGLTPRFMQWQQIHLIDRILLCVAILLLFFYVVYISKYFEFFQMDMVFQFNRKLSRIPFYRDLRAVAALGLGVVIVLWFLSRKKNIHVMIATMATVLILIFANGQEMWYQIFRNVGIGMLALLAIDEVPATNWRRIFILLLIVCYLALTGVSFAGMTPLFRHDDYLGQSFKERLQAYLIDVRKLNNKNMTIAFNGTGADMLLYNQLTALNIDFVRRMPAEMTAPRTVDICIHIERAEDPVWLRENSFFDLPDPTLCRNGMLLSSSKNDFRVLDAIEYGVMWRRAREVCASQSPKKCNFNILLE